MKESMDLDDLAAHLVQRQNRRFSEAQALMARYRAYLDRVDGLFAEVRAWLQPLCDQGLLSFHHSLIRRDCLIRPEPILGLKVVLGPFSLIFTPLSPDLAGVEDLSPAVGPPKPVFCIVLSPTHRSPKALPASLTLVPDEGGNWRVNQGRSLTQSQSFDERFLASFLAQCLAAVDGARRPS
jgi:hypothetical protein